MVCAIINFLMKNKSDLWGFHKIEPKQLCCFFFKAPNLLAPQAIADEGCKGFNTKQGKTNVRRVFPSVKAFFYIIIQSIMLLSATCAHAIVDITDPTAKKQVERKEIDAFSIIEFGDDADDKVIQRAGEGFQKDLELEIYDDFQDILIQGEVLEGNNQDASGGDDSGTSQGLDIVILEDQDSDSSITSSDTQDMVGDEAADEEEQLEPQVAESTKSDSDIIKSLTLPEAQIKILDKFTGKTYSLSINESDETAFEDDLVIRLDKCWMEPDGNLLSKHTALIEVKDLQSKKRNQFSRHWVFSHNVELNTFSTEKYYILLDKCGPKG